MSLNGNAISLLNKLKVALGISTNHLKKAKEEDAIVVDEVDESEVFFDQRIVFAESLRKLPIEQMTKLIKMIQEDSPKLISDVDSDRIEIKITDFDTNSFDKYMKFIQNWINKGDHLKERSEIDSKIKSIDWEHSKSYLEDEQMDDSDEESQD